MDVSALGWGVAGGAVLLALSLAGISLWLTTRTGSVASLERIVSEVRLELADVVDRVEQWQKRDRVRRLREGKESLDDPAAAGTAAAVPVNARMIALRARRLAQGR